MRSSTVVTAILALAFVPGVVIGQARMEGLAGSGSALLTGVDAVNPALLASSHGVSFRLLGLTANASNNSFSITDYNTYNGLHFTQGDKDAILGKIDGSLEGHTNLLVSTPSFSAGSFALTSRARGGVLGAFPKAVFELILNGNAPGKDYSFDTAKGSAIAIGEARLSHGRRVDFGGPVGAVDVGVTFKYLYGGAYAQIEEAHGSVLTDPDQIHGQGFFRARTALGGSGYGLDLGARREIGHGWSAAVGMQDIGSTIKWNRETKEADVRIDIANGNMHSLEDGADLVEETHDTRDIGSFRTTIPTVMTFGVAHQARKLLLAADWEQGFAESGLTDTKPRFSAGAEYRPIGFIAARGGWSVGGRDGKAAACGLGLRPGPLRLDFALSSCGRFLPGGGRGIGGGFSLGFGGQ